MQYFWWHFEAVLLLYLPLGPLEKSVGLKLESADVVFYLNAVL